MQKILISDPVDKRCEEILKREGFLVDYKPGLSPDELKKIISIYNGLVVRSETKVDSSVITLMDSMEVIGRAGAGVDNIDVESATRKGILVMNTPGGNTISAAEHTLAMMLALCRNIPRADQSLKEGKWERKKFTGTELSGKTLLIIGLGKIGKEVAHRSRSFGMDLLAYDPVINPTSVAIGSGIEFVPLEEGFRRADFITVHVPFSPSTRNLINKESLDSCKTGVKIINCARGGIVNESDVIEAIDAGKVSGAAFDVFEKEPPDMSSKILHHPKVICTPHLGASTGEAQEKVAVQIAEQFLEYFRERKFSGVINIPFEKIEDKLLSYIELAEEIGYLQSQFLKSQLKEVKISISGEFLQSNSSAVISGLIKGFLSDRRTDNINLVNAPVLFKESGIPVSEIKVPDDENFNNLVTAVFSTTEGERSISGTVFGSKEKRIVKIDEYYIEFKPEGDYLIYYNEDKPGILAAVSSIVAKEGLNISGVSLGRNLQEQRALSIISIDGEIPVKLKEKIAGIEGLIDLYPVKKRGRR